MYQEVVANIIDIARPIADTARPIARLIVDTARPIADIANKEWTEKKN